MIFLEALLWDFALLEGIAMPSPPRRIGKARSSRSRSLQALCPVKAGTNFSLIAASSGSRRRSISGIVLAKYVHLLDKPRLSHREGRKAVGGQTSV